MCAIKNKTTWKCLLRFGNDCAGAMGKITHETIQFNEINAPRNSFVCWNEFSGQTHVYIYKGQFFLRPRFTVSLVFASLSVTMILVLFASSC